MYFKDLFFNVLAQLILLPLLEIFSTILGFFVCVFFIHFSVFIGNGCANFLYEPIKFMYNFLRWYDTGSFVETFTFSFYPTRLIFLTVRAFEYKFIDGCVALLATWVYWYVYLFLIDYFSLVWFKRTPSMMLAGLYIFDVDSKYLLSKRQYFVRTLNKINQVYFGVILAINEQRLAYFYDPFSDDYYCNTKSETQTIPVSEYKRIQREEKEQNIIRIQKIFIKEKSLFNLQYQEIIPDKKAQPQQNQPYQYKETTATNDFTQQYSHVLNTQTEPIEQNQTEHIDIQDEEFARILEKKHAKKTKKEIQHEELLKQYSDLIDK